MKLGSSKGSYDKPYKSAEDLIIDIIIIHFFPFKAIPLRCNALIYAWVFSNPWSTIHAEQSAMINSLGVGVKDCWQP